MSLALVKRSALSRPITAAEHDANLTAIETKFGEVLSVKSDFGAKGDGTTDDTTAWQAFLNLLFSTSGSIGIVPRGKYRITSLLKPPVPNGTTIGAVNGVTIIGAGAPNVDPLSTGYGTFLGSALVWDGTLGGTMLELDRQVGVRLDGILFCGKLTSGASNRAAIGMLVSKGAGFDIGSGGHDLGNIAFANIDVGVQFGVNTTDTNCDTCSIRRIAGINVNSLFKTMNDQALGYLIDRMDCTNVKRALDVQRGGYFVVKMLNANQSGGGATGSNGVAAGASDYVVSIEGNAGGNNAYPFVIDNARVEQGTWQVVRADGKCQVALNGLTEGQSQSDKIMFRASGGAIVLNNCALLTHGYTTPTFACTAGSGQWGHITVNNSMLGADPFKMYEWYDMESGLIVNTYGHFRLNGCRDLQHRLIPNRGTRLEHGEVVVEGQTTDATPRKLLLDYQTGTATYVNSLTIPYGVVEVELEVVGRSTTDTTRARFVRRGRISTPTSTGTPAITTSFAAPSTRPDIATSTEAVSVAVNATYNSLEVTVTGVAATTIDWRCRARLLNEHVTPSL